MLKYSEEQIVAMGLTPKATYGGNVVSFTHPSTGNYAWGIEELTDILSLIQRRANKLVAQRNKKLNALFASKAASLECPECENKGCVECDGPEHRAA